MDLAVAIRATPVKEERRIFAPGSYRVLRVTVTLGAQSRVGNFEQAIVDRAVGFVAVGAIFPHRRMFVQKRAAPFRVAQITGFIDARLFELGRVGSSVRIMAVGTGQRAFF